MGVVLGDAACTPVVDRWVSAAAICPQYRQKLARYWMLEQMLSKHVTTGCFARSGYELPGTDSFTLSGSSAYFQDCWLALPHSDRDCIVTNPDFMYFLNFCLVDLISKIYNHSRRKQKIQKLERNQGRKEGRKGAIQERRKGGMEEQAEKTEK